MILGEDKWHHKHFIIVGNGKETRDGTFISNTIYFYSHAFNEPSP